MKITYEKFIKIITLKLEYKIGKKILKESNYSGIKKWNDKILKLT